MKKLLPIAVFAVAASMFTSCKKDYTCTCTWKDNGTTVTSQSYTFKATKSDATSACSAKATTTGYGSTVTVECKL